MKEPSLKLGGRLQLCASFVRQGTRLCDVGTDHAYLPIWLVLNGCVSSALACDVREGPLETARANVLHYGLQQKISLRLSDGLKKISSQEADDIVIAGMGGDLISRIATETAWVKDPKKRLILQPMTKPVRLRTAMAQSGFSLLREEAAFDDHRVYTVMQYQYLPQEIQNCRKAELYTGGMTGKNAAEKEYLRQQCVNLKRHLAGLLRTGKTEETENLRLAAAQIEKILFMKGEDEQDDDNRRNL
ncbi:MAG: class I SAM-dependent methyltransferase [Oscillospiraceae bacterium]|nr:class I SAM-dependent methyltransferase [Oscillospiraceae bacterium]